MLAVVVVVVFVAAGTTDVGAALAGLVAAGTLVAAPLAPGVPDVGVVAAGVAAGNVVIGVGSGGSGLDNTVAIISLRPASDELWRYLYQVLNASSQSFLLT